MGAPTVTYTLNNGDVADAAKLNTNFTDLINGLSDGTKDLTVAGLITKGNTTIGDVATDTVALTAVVSTDIIPSADATKDLGSAAAKWAELHAVTCNLDGAVTVNESGADVDFRIESDTRANAFFLDGTNGRIGLNNGAPDVDLHLTTVTSGEFRIESTALADDSASRLLITAKRSGSANYRGAAIGSFYQIGSTSNETCGYLLMQPSDGTVNYLWVDDDDVMRISTDPANIGEKNGTILGAQTSDIRLKKNIQEISEESIPKIMAMNPVRFEMDDRSQLGFIAQEIINVVPESVYDTKTKIDDSENTKLGMQYHQLIPVLVKAMQEQQAMILEMKAKLDTL